MRVRYPRDTTGLICASLYSRGFTIVEVMIGLALSMLSMLVIVQLFSMSDARKRATTGAAEAQQTANVSVYQLTRIVRLAGAGLTQARSLWGCPIQAYRGGTQILPPSSTFASAPSAFVNVYSRYPTVRAIPLLILPAAAPDAVSDVIVVIAGNSETGQAELQVLGQPAEATLSVQRLNGVRALDLILVTVPSAISNCLIGQVDTTINATSAPNTLPLGGAGTNYTATGLGGSAYNSASVPLPLGTTPMFTMFGVDSNKSLSQFDLLNLTGTATSVVAENVVDMRALYGVVSANGSGPIAWQAPNAAPWDVASLTAGTTAALDLVDRIRAVRIAMVFRGTEPVRDDSPPTSYVVFPDIASPITVPISAADQPYRYQVYDTVVPLRNLNYVPQCSTANPLPRCQ